MTPIRLDFEIGHCNGAMSLEIETTCSQQQFFNISETWLTVNLEIKWPDYVRINLLGKDLSKDTKVDNFGNIVANKYVKLTGVQVLNMDVIEPAMYRICKFYPALGQQTTDIFWDRNGTAELRFDQKNPMTWNLSINNILNFRNE